MKATDELLIAVVELEPPQLHAFEKTLSLSLVTDRRRFPRAWALAELPLHHQDQPPEALELNVVVDIEN